MSNVFIVPKFILHFLIQVILNCSCMFLFKSPPDLSMGQKLVLLNLTLLSGLWQLFHFRLATQNGSIDPFLSLLSVKWRCCCQLPV